jgi:acyl carrier protein
MLTEQQLRAIVAEAKEDIDAAALALDALFSDSGFDSLDQASILLGIQEHHGIVIPAEVENDMVSMQAILDYLATTKAS